MKKSIIIIGLLISFSLFLFGCQKQEPVVQQLNCTQMGYIPVSDANSLVNITNKLVDLSNICFANLNLTPLKHVNYWSEENISQP
jgi:hypothetical protein